MLTELQIYDLTTLISYYGERQRNFGMCLTLDKIAPSEYCTEQLAVSRELANKSDTTLQQFIAELAAK